MTREQAAAQAASRSFLNDAQRTVIQEVLTSSDRIHGIQGLAGTGKTTTLATVREGAEQSGYKVEGFAPASRAEGQLREAGIEAATLQSFLARGQNHPSTASASPHLYMLDESSLASTRQMRAFLDKIGPEDRVLVIGDTAQHQGVDAGRPFEQMQDAGMQTSRLDRIIRQKDPALREAVQHLAKGETIEGIKMLADQGRITEIADPNERIAAIARDYAANPEKTIIVSPDNRSRQLINQAVRCQGLASLPLWLLSLATFTPRNRVDLAASAHGGCGTPQCLLRRAGKNHMLSLLMASQARPDGVAGAARCGTVSELLASGFHLVEIASRLSFPPGAEGVIADGQQVGLGAT